MSFFVLYLAVKLVAGDGAESDRIWSTCYIYRVIFTEPHNYETVSMKAKPRASYLTIDSHRTKLGRGHRDN